MSSRVLSTANEITVLRLVFAPIFAILVVDHHFKAALAVLALAAISDAADGYVARAYHQQTPLGVALDPIADKVLMTTAFLVLAFDHVLPWWLTIVVVARDAGILLTAAAISVVSGYRPFPPSLLGKASTVVQVSMVLLAVAGKAGLSIPAYLVKPVLTDLTVGLAAASGLHYLLIARQRFGLSSTPDEVDLPPDSQPNEIPKVKVRVKVE